MLAWLFAIQWICLSAFAQNAPKPIKFLLPNGIYSLNAEREIALLVDEFNRTHLATPVEMSRKGEDFSSLKEVIASHLADALPDLAAIECAEFPTLEQMRLHKLIPAAKSSLIFDSLSPWATAPLKAQKLDRQFLPFQRIAPILIADQEMLFRYHVNPEQLPKTWKDLVKLAQRLSQNGEPSSDHYSLAIPLQGPRGLWIFEAISGEPLWTRETHGGLKTNSKLTKPIEAIGELLSDPKSAKSNLNWETAIQDFLDRRSPLLVTSNDMLPYIASQSTFRWSIAPLPKIPGGYADLATGSDLVVFKDTPGVWNFLEYLYQSKSANRWISAGSYLPIKPQWTTHELLKPALKTLNPKQIRSTDRQIVRARSVWIQGLQALFGEPTRRLPTSMVFSQIDSDLGS